MQHDLDVANGAAASVRTDINNAILALSDRQSGATAPVSPRAHQLWLDTATGVVKRRNAGNTAWVIDSPVTDLPTVSRSSNVILTLADHGKTIYATGTFTQTFAAAASFLSGWRVRYVNEGAGTITLTPAGGDLINGAASLSVLPGNWVEIVYNGSAFRANVSPENLSVAGGSEAIGWSQSGTGAVLISTRSKVRDIEISLKDFGADQTGVVDARAAWDLTVAEIDARGGGILKVPVGVFVSATGFVLGNGSNSAPSSVHNRITIRGEGYGASTALINQQVAGASKLKYTGAISASAAVLELRGPMYGVSVQNVELDCDAKAGRGIIVNHLTSSTFRRVSSRNYRAIGWEFTTRTGFPVGCAFGCGDNRIEQCYGWLDNAALATLDIIGISLSSGVSAATDLAGQPDSARNFFTGGTFMYGTTVNSHGSYLSGADNNDFDKVHFTPYGGSTLGYDAWLQQWPAAGPSAGVFPHENWWRNCGMTRGISGNGGVGSSWGNTIFPLGTSDGAPLPSVTGISGIDHTGKTFVRGQRSWRARQVGKASINASVQSHSTTTRTNVPGLSVSLTTLPDSKLRIHFSGRIAKSTAGSGNFVIALNGTVLGNTFSDVTATGFFVPTAACDQVDVGGGTQTITIQFQSSDTNAVQISHATLIVEELY